MKFNAAGCRKLFIWLLLLAGMRVSGSITGPLPPLVSDTLDQFILRSMKNWNVPGLAVCIVKDGKLIVSKGYGVTEAGKNTPVDANTLFMIGSNTKAFTSTALSMLDYEGKCSLDDQVSKWLPSFSQTDPLAARESSLRDLLCHRLGYETFQGDFMYWDSELSQAEVLEKFGRLKPVHSFRSKFGYTNAAFLAAGLCIGTISGESWENYVIHKLLVPLEMNRSLCLMKDYAQASNKAIPHKFVNGRLQTIPFCNIDNMAAAASMSSTANDISHWLIALLDKGKYKDQQVIPFPAILRTRMPQSIVGRNLAGSKSIYKLYGLGWFLQDYNSREVISHSGAVDGFLSSVTLIPEEKIGIAIFTNTDENELFETLKWELIDAFLGIPSANFDGDILAEFNENRMLEDQRINQWNDSAALHIPPEVSLKSFCGLYSHPVYGSIAISLQESSLRLSFQHHPQLTARLDYIGHNRFLCTYSNPVFGICVFPFSVKGRKVDSFTLSVSDFIESTTYTFSKKH